MFKISRLLILISIFFAFEPVQLIEARPKLSTVKPVFTRIQFTKKKNTATIENSVINGKRDKYLLKAKKGQQMTVNIASIEKNAVFDIVSPSGEILSQENTSWEHKLLTKGNYQIIVGSTRGNATYRMKVTVK